MTLNYNNYQTERVMAVFDELTLPLRQRELSTSKHTSHFGCTSSMDVFNLLLLVLTLSCNITIFLPYNKYNERNLSEAWCNKSYQMVNVNLLIGVHLLLLLELINFLFLCFQFERYIKLFYDPINTEKRVF